MGGKFLQLGALVSLVILFGVFKLDASTTPAGPESADKLVMSGFSQEGVNAIQEMMETAIANQRITAGIAMMARDGKIVSRPRRRDDRQGRNRDRSLLPHCRSVRS